MHLSGILLDHFRNIEAEEITFTPGVNVLWGDNAQGKSNILEAIYFCARGKSFRGATEKQLIGHGSGHASIKVEFQKKEAEFPSTLEYTLFETGRKTMLRDGVRENSVYKMVGRLNTVIFTPQHLSIVTGGPAERRAFLDIGISLCFPPYMTALGAFKKTLDERNALIRYTAKSGEPPRLDMFEVFAFNLARVAAYIASCRYDYVRRLNFLANGQLRSLSHGKDALELTYLPKGGTLQAPGRSHTDPVLGMGSVLDEVYVEEMKKLLMSDIPREVMAGTTLYGPQRDDIDILLNGVPARHFASQGQTRSIALSMKLAEGEVSRYMLRERPVYLLDDVLSELDERRREYLLTELRNDQIIITSCEPDFRVRNITSYSLLKRQQVKDGKIVRE